MPAPLGSPFLGTRASDFGPLADPQSKFGRVIRKEGRVSAPDLECASSGEKMTKKTGEHSIDRNKGAESVRIVKARNFIAAHYSDELSLREVARAANTSANYFSEKFKEATGLNFVKYVARVRFEKAAALLGGADLRVSEIAFATGFQSLSQFNRVFKKFSGKSPSEYRAAAARDRKRRDRKGFYR